MSNIKNARISAGLSQKEVAITLHVSAPTVSEWESGRKSPTLDNLMRLAKLFDVSTDYLLGEENAAAKSSNVAARLILSADNISPMPGVRSVPRVGSIACGTPILAEQNIVFYDRFNDLCMKNGLTPGGACKKMGLSRSLAAKWKATNTKIPAHETLVIIANFFSVSIDYLLGEENSAAKSSDVAARLILSADNISPMPGVRSVPRVGSIACGTPILAEQNIEGFDSVPDFVSCDFTLVARGDSMTGARIHDGDIVFIRQQETVENGQIAAVLIDDETESGSATLKRVRFSDDSVILWPENPNYQPMIFTGPDRSRVHILGLATHFISTIQ